MTARLAFDKGGEGDLELFMSPPAKLASLSVSDLCDEIARRERCGQALLRKRARRAAKPDALNTQTAAWGLASRVRGNGSRSDGKRYKNERIFVKAFGKALKGKTMGATEAMEAVQKVGCRSTAKNFRMIVNLALIKSGKFKRVERGRYTAK